MGSAVNLESSNRRLFPCIAGNVPGLGEAGSPMKVITIHRLSLQFDADQVTHGSPEDQATQAVDQINAVLQCDGQGLNAQLIATPDEIEVETAIEPCEACGGDGWLRVNVGNDQKPKHQIQRCDACEQFASDEAALEAMIKAAGFGPVTQRKDSP